MTAVLIGALAAAALALTARHANRKPVPIRVKSKKRNKK